MSLADDIKKSWRFYAARELEDGTIVGLGPLMFTTAVYIDVNATGWMYRFCFKEFEDAEREYQKLVTGDDKPEGYVAWREA